MLIHLNPDNPQERQLNQIVECLRNGGVIIYPTDTVYAFGCDIHQKKAVERICKIKGIAPEKARLSFVCESVKSLGVYANHVTTPLFKIIRNAEPGPYTFIFEASKLVPRHYQDRRKSVGIRITNQPIAQELIRLLGHPIGSISLPDSEDLEPEFRTDPELIHERFEKLVDMVIDGGIGGLEPSTIVDMSNGEHDIVVVREGKGSLSALGLIALEDR